MARVKDSGYSFAVYVSRIDSGNWADGWFGTGRWPCSALGGKRLVATYDSQGLLDYRVNGGRGPQEVDADELNACVSYFAGQELAEDHPCYFVAVGQFI